MYKVLKKYYYTFIKKKKLGWDLWESFSNAVCRTSLRALLVFVMGGGRGSAAFLCLSVGVNIVSTAQLWEMKNFMVRTSRSDTKKSKQDVYSIVFSQDIKLLL